MNTRTLRHAAAALVLAAVLTPAAGFCAPRPHTLSETVAHQASSLLQSFVRMLLDVGISMDGNG
jgi:hypothetical protein